ncbi:MAG: LysE family transporter [Syntrophomonadaceae bacterium]|nr:LysE family transporter [Syntrophomonadaceae bacterium]MDD3271228.1 LysE family transporter [Syntrophomonadaceae bacterium]MDD3897737.1 LysE family transporter [Syntrophomonadaceae bacterium]MDD4562457.1 LysE family transporter [Syntrophomonadaceae bacterium]
MDITALFITAFLVGLSGAMMPGPLLTVAIAESARRGFKAGPLIVLGHGILELALIIALLAGLSYYLQKPVVTTVISVIGGAFLLFMGFNMIRDVLQGRVTLESSDNDAGTGINMHPVMAGILVSISNPFWSIWWATIGLTYLTMALKSGTMGIASFFSGHIMADLLWYSLISAAIAGGRRFLKQSVYQTIIMFCGLFLIGLGGYFIYGVI